MRIPTSFMRVIRSTHFLPAVLQLAAFLSIVPTISASPLSPRDNPLPANWTSLGCITDNVQIPTLTAWGYSGQDMTVGLCVNHCVSKGLIYAGLENGTDCYCGNYLSTIAMNATVSDCDIPCAGDPTEMCGAPLRLNLYWSGAPLPPPPTLVPTSSTGPWNYLGCYNNSNSQRILESPIDSMPGGRFNTSVETCTDECHAQGYVVAGIEWAWQCYCGHLLNYPGMTMPDKDCMLPCSGNQSELCGGPDRMTVYFYTGTL
ncbi:WSC domain-containing protein [Lactarius vividus]|nr:WSC domain-containing protein [Lactarius vividus]